MPDSRTAITDLALFQTNLQIEGGIWKRLDEIRKLTQLLQCDAPEFLAMHP